MISSTVPSTQLVLLAVKQLQVKTLNNDAIENWSISQKSENEHSLMSHSTHFEDESFQAIEWTGTDNSDHRRLGYT